MEAYIINGYRSAVGKSKKGGFRFYRPDDLAADVIKHLVASTPGLESKLVDDLIVGNAVPEAEQGMQMGRMISLLSLGIDTPGFVMNRYCGSGLEAIALAVGKIKAGMADCIIAGGTESMSLVPTVGYKTVPNYTIAAEHPDYFIGMGLTAEEVAVKYNISREDQDAFSAQSQNRAEAAINAGRFDGEIVPVSVQTRKETIEITKDEFPRSGVTAQELAKLRPAFKKDGTVTAANASGINDGAAAVLLMRESEAKKRNLIPLAIIKSWATKGVDPSMMGTGPIPASAAALKKAGWSVNDLDLIVTSTSGEIYYDDIRPNRA